MTNWARLQSVRTLKQERVFRLCMSDGADYVVKRIRNEALDEVVASEIGAIERLGVQTIPVAAIRLEGELLAAWRGVAPVSISSDELLLLMPYVDAPPLRFAGHHYCAGTAAQKLALYEAMGRMWAFDIFIDNTDRLIKGINSENLLISEDLRAYAIDQSLGRDMTELHRNGERARRRLDPMLAPAGRERAWLDLFQQINRDLTLYRFDDPEPFCHGMDAGFLAGVRAVATLTESEVEASIATGRTFIPGVGAMIEAFRRAAAELC